MPRKRGQAGHEVRGHPARYDWQAAEYIDPKTGRVLDNDTMPCARCGLAPTPDGHDPCLGTLPGVTAACCGHGVRQGYIMFSNGRVVRWRGDGMSVDHREYLPGREGWNGWGANINVRKARRRRK